jgi:outer membrane protein assembly factor BamB
MSRSLTRLCSAIAVVALLTDAWPAYRGGLANDGAVAGAKVSSKIALTPAWSFRAASWITSSPTSAYGLVYVGTWNGRVVALREQTGKVVWSASLGANPERVYGGPRGVIGSIAIAGHRVFAVSGSCVAASFVAETGRQVWRRRVCSLARNDDTFASPVVAGGLVMFGIDITADRPTDQGRLIALDARTGRTRWVFDPVRYRGTGSGISASPAVDLRRGLAFIGTGNPTPVGSPPPGPDRLSESIVALDLRTGALRWSYGPVHPHDRLDRDFFASPNLFWIVGRAHSHEAVGEGNKDGVYYVVDARTGAPLWRTRADPHLAYGWILGTAAVAAGLIVVPVWAGDAHGSLVALDARNGSVRWRRTMRGVYGAPLIFGEVVFALESDGTLVALRLADGKQLLSLALGTPAHGRGPSADGDRLLVTADSRLYTFKLAGA